MKAQTLSILPKVTQLVPDGAVTESQSACLPHAAPSDTHDGQLLCCVLQSLPGEEMQPTSESSGLLFP